jgi:hypothetical protein
VEVGRRGSLLGYRSLVALYAGIFLWKHVVVYEVGSQQFVSYVQVPSIVDFFDETADEGFVLLFVRHRSLLLLVANSPFYNRSTPSMMPPEKVRRIERRLIHRSA